MLYYNHKREIQRRYPMNYYYELHEAEWLEEQELLNASEDADPAK